MDGTEMETEKMGSRPQENENGWDRRQKKRDGNENKTKRMETRRK